MKIILVGHPGSQHIVPASKFLTSKYLPDFEITYLNYGGPIEGWAKWVAHELSKRNDKFIIFALDDYLVSGFNKRLFDNAEHLISVDPNVACIKLCDCTSEEHQEYPITTQYCLWHRIDLIRILIDVNTPWEFEIKGSELFRAWGHGSQSVMVSCISYFTNSSLSKKWEGINLTGVREKDIKEMRDLGLLPKEQPTKIVVFGGSGFLGQELIAALLRTTISSPKQILAVSRNEGALVSLKEKFPGISIMVGDIADPWIVKRAMVDAHTVFHLAAMKHVGLAEIDVKSCVSTNIVGTMNIINESLTSKPARLVFISTDKAAQSTGVYGCSKKIGERMMVEAEKINRDTQYRVIRYGNVWGSTGSISTKWKPKMEKGEEVIITDRKASRFFWTVDEAVDLIFECISKATSAEPYIPKMRAVTMGTVLDACLEVWGQSPVKEIGLQPGENLVETTDGKIFSDTCEQFSKEEFKMKFLGAGDFVNGTMVGPVELQDHPSCKKSSPKISCIIITREDRLDERVLERLSPEFFDEILIVPKCENIYTRYLAAAQAKNEIIYVQDDDCMVNYQELFKHYDGRITNAMPKAFIEKYQGTQCTLVGWGCFFPKSILEGTFDKYIAKYGIDKHLLREADRIFTYVNQPWNTVVMPHEDLPQTAEKMSLQPNHYESMDEALIKMQSFYLADYKDI